MELSLLRTELPLHLVHIRFDARSSEGSDVSRVHGKTLCLSLSLSLSLVCPANERTDARLKDCEKVSSVCERLMRPQNSHDSTPSAGQRRTTSKSRSRARVSRALAGTSAGPG